MSSSQYQEKKSLAKVVIAIGLLLLASSFICIPFNLYGAFVCLGLGGLIAIVGAFMYRNVRESQGVSRVNPVVSYQYGSFKRTVVRPAPAPQPAPVKETVTFCPQCGSKNLATSRFCTSCGSALTSSPAPVPPVPPQPSVPPTPPQPVAPVVEVCPVCGREDYRMDDFCKWCGATFDTDGQVIPDLITKAHDYFRHPWNVSSVETYDTLSAPLNHMFFSYLAQGLPDCTVQSKVAASTLFPTAMPYAMPINFLVSKGDKKVAVLLVERARFKRYSLLEIKELCKENGVPVLSFYFECDNEESYVVDRIRKALE